jgi:ankyrin repeat protein
MIRLQYCNYWLYEDCLSKSVLDSYYPTYRIWLASLDNTQVLTGAASAGDILKVKELLEKHTPCIVQDYYSKTPLYLVVLEGYEEVVKELLDHRVDTATTDFKGQTVLYLAIQGYSLGILRLLLERGADMAARNGKDIILLYFIYQKGIIRIIDYLIEKRASKEAKAIYGLTPEMLHPLSIYSEVIRRLVTIHYILIDTSIPYYLLYLILVYRLSSRFRNSNLNASRKQVPTETLLE